MGGSGYGVKEDHGQECGGLGVGVGGHGRGL